MSLTEQWNRHSKAVEEVNKSIGGMSFERAPFDIITKDGNRFYEVKAPSDRRGRHRGECRITISESERKFGEIFYNRFVIIILFDGMRYDIPFLELKGRIMRNAPHRSSLGGFVRIHRQITLGKSFLAKYTTR